jgi:catechol 2,3-dioxygenase-like lactoylglutathione lyase family enzyme
VPPGAAALEVTMVTRVHVHLKVNDLAASRDFYRKFFGADPVKEKTDQIKFTPEFAPINLALSSARDSAEERSVINHLGIEVESSAQVINHLARVKAAGLAVREELVVNCCYANQTKFWVKDPDGVEWEIYHLNYDLAERHGGAIENPVPGGVSKPSPLAAVSAEPCCGARSRV